MRRGRQFELTSLAERLAPLASDAMDAAAGLLGAENSFDPSDSTKRFTISLSEYAMTVLAEPLSRAFQDRAPGCSIAFDAIPTDSRRIERQLMRRDLLVGTTGFGLPGIVEPLFRDRIVCIVDERNPVGASGTLTLEQLRSLPRAVAEIGPRDRTRRRFEDAEAQTALAEGRVRIVVSSLLTLPFVISGTDMCGFVPARLAASCPEALRLRRVQSPLPERDIVEAMHWHPTRAHDASAKWLRALLHEIADQLGVVAT